MQTLTTFLWFDGLAEDAARFYTSIFKDSKLGEISRYTEAGPLPEGAVLVANFEIMGQQFCALNGGPEYKFTPAISLMINCDTQEEVDYYWEKLTSGGGEEVQCGWLTDKFGLSWQVTPRALIELISKPDRARVDNVMKAMFEMKKLDIAKLQAAYDQPVDVLAT